MNVGEFLSNIDPDHVMYAILAFIMVSCTIYLYRLNEDQRNDIDIMDLVTTNGKLNERKFTRFITWIVSTWGFIYLIASQNLTEWYFIGYMGAWVANALIGKALPDRESMPDRTYRDPENTPPYNR